MSKRAHIIIGALGLLVLLAVVQVSVAARSDPWKAEDAVYKGILRYDPEWIVVPPRLIGDSPGTTDREIPFEPYGSDPQYGKPIIDTIPAGTPYYEIVGYSTWTYIAIPYKSNYFLYARPLHKKVIFPRGEGNAALVAQFAGTPEQAYLEAFKDVSAYAADFLVLDVRRASLDDPNALIALVEQHCEERGATLIITSFQTVEDKGYFEGNPPYWYFSDGLLISLEGGTFDGDHATIETSVGAAALAGQGRSCSLEKEDGVWVFAGSMMTWIS